MTMQSFARAMSALLDDEPAAPPPMPASPLARAVFGEVAGALTRLADRGEPTIIDIRCLPFQPDDFAALDQLLGEGEVSCALSIAGRSEVKETSYAGVWRVRHFGEGDAYAADEIHIALVPDILTAHPDDVAYAARRIIDGLVAHETVTRTTPAEQTAA
jgi:hydrogenase-1 operon protein HyaF